MVALIKYHISDEIDICGGNEGASSPDVAAEMDHLLNLTSSLKVGILPSGISGP